MAILSCEEWLCILCPHQPLWVLSWHCVASVSSLSVASCGSQLFPSLWASPGSALSPTPGLPSSHLLLTLNFCGVNVRVSLVSFLSAQDLISLTRHCLIF